MGHPQTEGAAGLEHVAGADIVTRHQADRLRELLDPGRELALQILPAAGSGVAAREDVAGAARRARGRREGRGPLLRPAARGCLRIAVEGERLEAAAEQVLGAEPADRGVVGIEVGDAGGGIVPAVAAADAHDRDRQPADRGGHAAVVEIGDDPVPLPTLEIGQLLQRILLNIEAPAGVLLHILRDAADDQPVIRAGGVEDHGHEPRRRAVLRMPADHRRHLCQPSRCSRTVRSSAS